MISLITQPGGAGMSQTAADLRYLKINGDVQTLVGANADQARQNLGMVISGTNLDITEADGVTVVDIPFYPHGTAP